LVRGEGLARSRVESSNTIRWSGFAAMLGGCLFAGFYVK
jgi:hypothetical protein